MSKNQKFSLAGLLLIIFGIFLPMYREYEYVNVNNRVFQQIAGLQYGYNEIPGVAMLIVTVLLSILIFILIKDQHQDVYKGVKAFLIALISLLFLSAVIKPIQTSDIRPGLGLLFIVIGLTLNYIALYKEQKRQ